MESSRSDVVSEGVPGTCGLTRSRRRQGLHRREPLKPLFVFWLDPVHLGLLQHDLGHQNSIGITGSPPGQITSVPVVPAEGGDCENADARGAAGSWDDFGRLALAEGIKQERV